MGGGVVGALCVISRSPSPFVGSRKLGQRQTSHRPLGPSQGVAEGDILTQREQAVAQ